MSKLLIVKAKEIIKFLDARGFFVVSQSGSHLKMKNNLGNIVIVPVHSQKDVPKGTLLSILRQAGLSKEDLIRFFE